LFATAGLFRTASRRRVGRAAAIPGRSLPVERHDPALDREWFPFGGGGRACLGMAFALYEMKVVLATLLAGVRLARPVDSRSAAVRQGIALGPDDGAVMTVAGRG
jgi:cytochrome P450